VPRKRDHCEISEAIGERAVRVAVEIASVAFAAPDELAHL